MKHRIYHAAKITLLQFSMLHLILIAIQAIRSGDYQLLTMISILDLQFFFPDLSYNTLTIMLTAFPVVIMLAINALRTKDHS